MPTSNNLTLGDSVEVISKNYFSDIRTRSLVDAPSIYSAKIINSSIPPNMAMDFSRIVNKPFRVGTFVWSNTNSRFDVISVLPLPSSLLSFLPCGSTLRAPFEVAALYRTKMKLLFQVSGTSMHQGTLIVAAMPYDFASQTVDGNRASRIASYMSAPHTFLYANGSSSTTLEVPFYANTKFLYTDIISDTINFDGNLGDYAEIFVEVLNPLVVPSSSMSSLSVTIFVVFEEADFYIPHSDVTFRAESSMISGLIDTVTAKVKTVSSDFIDGCRQVLRSETGLHNPNNSSINNKLIISDRNILNTVDTETFLEKLDPFDTFNRYVTEPVFETEVDEMMINHILSKPQYIGTFKAKITDVSGQLLWSRPITPLQEVLVGETGVPRYSTPISILSLLSKYWRGGLKIHIQSNMSNFHFCKLLVARDYSPVEEALGGHPIISTVSNLLTSSLEFSGGGQVQTVKLPYMSIFDQLEITSDWQMNALSHGMYYIYLDQPVVYNGSVSEVVEFNMYLSTDDDFQLYGYATNNLIMSALPAITEPVAPTFEAESLIDTTTNDSQIKIHSAKLVSPIYRNPNFHANFSVRDYIRRFVEIPFLNTTTADELVLNVATLAGVISIQTEEYTPIQIIQQMFLGYSGGLKFKIRATGVTDLQVSYLPPGMRMRHSTGTQITAVPSTILLGTAGPDELIANSDVIFHTNYDANKSYPTVKLETSTKTRYNSLPRAVVEIEGEIPNMSMFRFLGDLKTKTNNVGSTKVNSNTDMGHLIVSAGLIPDVVPQYRIFVSLPDSGRLGFQVHTPVVYPRTFFSSAGGAQLLYTPYNSDKASLYTPYANPLVIAPSCYFTNSP